MRAALLFFLVLLPSANAAEVYRCETANGVIRYSDKPCADGKAEKLAIENRPTDSVAVRQQAEQRKAEIAALETAEAEAAKSAAAAAEAEEKRKAQCEAARKRLASLVAARRITRGEGENLEYLDSAEIIERRQQAQDKVNELCDRV